MRKGMILTVLRNDAVENELQGSWIGKQIMTRQEFDGTSEETENPRSRQETRKENAILQVVGKFHKNQHHLLTKSKITTTSRNLTS